MTFSHMRECWSVLSITIMEKAEKIQTRLEKVLV